MPNTPKPPESLDFELPAARITDLSDIDDRESGAADFAELRDLDE